MAAGETGDALVEEFTPGAVLFASPCGTLLGDGRLATTSCPVTEPAEVAAHLRAALVRSDVTSPTGFGIVPFGRDRPAHFLVPERLVVGRRRRAGAARSGSCPPLRLRALTAMPEPAAYVRAVEAVLDEIRAGTVSKVVLARGLEAVSDEPIDVPDLVSRLAGLSSSGYLFAVPLPGTAPLGTAPLGTAPLGTAAHLVGLSPELLVSRRAERVVANPLAGSVPRAADAAEDDRRRRSLLASAKDLLEHDYVRSAVHDALAPYCRRLRVPRLPTVVRTPTLWHLSTTITGQVREGSTGALELALALHPTPAVCGTPARAAARLIDAHEHADRGYYAGLVGWEDLNGDGEWAVALRCAEVTGDRLMLHAGAGVVAGSDPADELRETSAKLATFLRAIGVAPDEHGVV